MLAQVCEIDLHLGAYLVNSSANGCGVSRIRHVILSCIVSESCAAARGARVLTGAK